MLEHVEVSPPSESPVAAPKHRNPAGNQGSGAFRIPGTSSRGREARAAEPAHSQPAPVPSKVAVNRPQQLLELAGKVTRAAWGGIVTTPTNEYYVRYRGCYEEPDGDKFTHRRNGKLI